MTSHTSKTHIFDQGLEKLGFNIDDDCLYLISNTKTLSDPQIRFHIEKAVDFSATAVYLRKQLNGSYKPQAYLYDYTGKLFEEEELINIQKKIWSSGECPLACIFYDTEIKILDCTTHIKPDRRPTYLVDKLNILGKAHNLYNSQFAIKLKSGMFWEQPENKDRFKFQYSSYDKIIKNINYITNTLKLEYKTISTSLVNKIIIQSILIKYLEERIDNEGNKLLSEKYFKKYDKATTFNDVLKRGKFVELLEALNDPITGFNGNLFDWKNEEKKIIKSINLDKLADLLNTNSSFQTGQLELWRYFEFKFIPVELISRLYEEFLGINKKDEGLFYTPSHLAKLLVDESLPLKNFQNINLDDFKVLDPACGSGIFLVITFKRLVQIWRLQNGMKLPQLIDLKKILRNIYGIDKEEQAVRLASFSLCLALCNELNPIDIINKLKLDDLTEANLIHSDFFDEHKLKNKKFDLIIGNPPFNRGAIKAYNSYSIYDHKKVNIPQGQIALKFLLDSIGYLKEDALLCLIIKSSGLLYNSTSSELKKVLFSSLNIVQILDFTALARNKSLWDNGADVASAAIFIKNQKPDFKNNVLHLTFKRTKATKERIVFEIDDYDLHFISRQIAIEDEFIWKNNLLGGGRIKSIIDRFKNNETFEMYASNNNLIVGEGYIIGHNGKLKPEYIYNIKTLATEAVTENGINYSQLKELDKNTKFVKLANEKIFYAPNIIIKENIGEEKLPVFFNEKSFSFKDKIIGISSRILDQTILKSIVRSFEKYTNFYRFYIYVTSSQLLINKNTAILKNDIMRLPFIKKEDDITFSDIDNNIIYDVLNYMQDFIRHGENSIVSQPINQKFIKDNLLHYGDQFCHILNLIYKNNGTKFRLSDVIILGNSFIATVFKYDSKDLSTNFHSNEAFFNFENMAHHNISQSLSSNRIVKLYTEKNTIVFVKPNQKRYWLSLMAYRDADKCFADLTKLGS